MCVLPFVMLCPVSMSALPGFVFVKPMVGTLTCLRLHRMLTFSRNEARRRHDAGIESEVGRQREVAVAGIGSRRHGDRGSGRTNRLCEFAWRTHVRLFPT